MREEHTDFVYSSWLKSYRQMSPARNEDYHAGQRQLIDHIRTHAKVRVATPKHDPLTIYGWICYGERAVVHYLYVKRPFRDYGLGRLLVRDMGPGELRPSHMTPMGEIFLRRLARTFAKTSVYLAMFPEL